MNILVCECVCVKPCVFPAVTAAVLVMPGWLTAVWCKALVLWFCFGFFCFFVLFVFSSLDSSPVTDSSFPAFVWRNRQIKRDSRRLCRCLFALFCGWSGTKSKPTQTRLTLTKWRSEKRRCFIFFSLSFQSQLLLEATETFEQLHNPTIITLSTFTSVLSLSFFFFHYIFFMFYAALCLCSLHWRHSWHDDAFL